MFDGFDDARQALARFFDPPQLEIVVESIVPTILFEPLPDNHRVVGGTRLGGLPDLPPGADWPRPAMPPDVEEIARRGNEYAAADMRQHMQRGIPYAFIAQVDLAEAASMPGAASVLPADGRLLFFYDLSVGPWETGTRVARVIWERSDRQILASPAMPADLFKAAEDERKKLKETVGPEAGGREGTVYGAPSRSMRMRPALRLPHSHSLESLRLHELAAESGGTDGEAVADAFSVQYDEALEANDTHDPAVAIRRQQLLGNPLPEQDDPRYDAARVTMLKKQFLSREEWQLHKEAIEREAENWLLLLQIDVGDWMQAEFVEGTVYFLIRKPDLSERLFDRVVAVYQQT